MRNGIATLMAAAIALAGGTSAAPAQPAAEYLYRTQAKDTLIGLSRRLLKDPRQWPALQKRNAIADPTRMPVGTSLRIPREWLRDTAETAVVTAVVGTVTGDGAALNAGDTLREGEQIATAAGAYITLTLADGTVVNLNSSGSLELGRLRRYVGTGRRDTELKLNRGGLDLHVKPQGEAGRFQIRTPVALSAVRGTEFRRVIDGAAETTAALDKTEVIGGSVSVAGIATSASPGAEVLVPGGYGTISEPGVGPRAPVKLLPPPDLSTVAQTLEDDPVRIAFASVPGAAAYHAQVARDQNFESIVAEITGTEAALTFDGLPDGRYFLRVRSRDPQGLEGADAIREFERHRLLGAPQPEEPRADAFVTGEGASFHWAVLPGASAYRFQLASDASFTTLISDQTGITNAGVAVAQVSPGTYFWRIAGVDQGGAAGRWSTAQRYRQKRPPAPLPAPTIHSNTFDVSWAGEPGQRYELQVARDPAFTQLVEQQQLRAPHAVLKPLDAGGSYYIRTRMVDEDGYVGPYTPPRRFVAPWPWWVKFTPIVLVLPFL